MPFTIGIQGDAGSTNEKACKFFARKYQWKNFEIRYLITTENVLRALENNKISYGTFAWKSSRNGLVEETQKAIKKYQFEKIDEVVLPSDHVLLANSKIDSEKVVHIFSHPQALEEHKSFLEKHFAKFSLHEEIDTAFAAKKLSQNEYPQNSLVLAPKSCAKIYGLKIFLENIPTNKGYETTIYLVKK
ncbi:prephenate dehydratase [Candidatus Peregrinibacteria bacterium]|nr:prephenate dehydratase [Candidatus Peregrinibacteria bacterium]